MILALLASEYGFYTAIDDGGITDFESFPQAFAAKLKWNLAGQVYRMSDNCHGNINKAAKRENSISLYAKAKMAR